MASERFEPDPSRPYQLEQGLLAIWLPRGRGRNDLARGLLATVHVCENPDCACTEARVGAILIDDRLAWVKQDRRGLKLSWRGASDRPPLSVAQLTLDFLTGEMTDARGGAVPADLAPFFREPLPAWVLDDIYAEWTRHRPPIPEPWFERALEEWKPGDMLPAFTACPEARPEQFVRDGKRYVVDFVFCIAPGCTCSRDRIVLLEVGATKEGLQTWTQIASAELGKEGALINQDGKAEGQKTLGAIYGEWRARSVNPIERVAELRTRTLLRGAELRELWEERERRRPVVAAAPVRPIEGSIPRGRPGRNDPCVCGSGKKYKKCCGG